MFAGIRRWKYSPQESPIINGNIILPSAEVPKNCWHLLGLFPYDSRMHIVKLHIIVLYKSASYYGMGRERSQNQQGRFKMEKSDKSRFRAISLQVLCVVMLHAWLRGIMLDFLSAFQLSGLVRYH